jgi:16S rRNA (uracil1498-N3)-methyltransferase
LFYVHAVHGGRAIVDGDSAAHLRRVLRVEAGQTYELSDGERLNLAEIAGFGLGTVEFSIIEQLPPRSPGACIILYAALLKFDRFEWMVEKATELGAGRLVPLVTARSEMGLEKAVLKRLPRWNRIAEESGQQCRRLRAMPVDAPLHFASVLAATHSQRLLLDEDGTAPLLTILRSVPGEIALLTGPEGGWTAPERVAARDAGWLAATLGQSVLRAETAALAALSLVQGWFWAQAARENPIGENPP